MYSQILFSNGIALTWNLGVFVFIRYSTEDGVSQSRQEVFVGGPSQAINSPEKEVIVSGHCTCIDQSFINTHT